MNDPDDDTAATDDWEEFREDEGEPICVEELKCLKLEDMPEDIHISVMDNYFPHTTIWCAGDRLICEIEEHLYTKYWEHKFSAYAFADAMERAVRRLRHEGHPFFEPSREDDDVHIFVRWQLRLPRLISPGLDKIGIRSRLAPGGFNSGEFRFGPGPRKGQRRCAGPPKDNRVQAAGSWLLHLYHQRGARPAWRKCRAKSTSLCTIIQVRAHREHGTVGPSLRNSSRC